MLKNREIILGVTGGIAVYKAVELLRLLVKAGAKVRVVMTRNAREFVSPLTFQTLSGFPVFTEMFNLIEESKIGHISLADRAEIFLICPATANIIGKIAGGISDDLLSTVVMAAKAPVLICPAMNVNMYNNPLVKRNIEELISLGYHFVEPALGKLACGYEGRGRLAEPEDIREEVISLLTKKDLEGERILITAGPTEEAIDPVRFIGNRSSGKMGYALAKEARRRGGEVVLVSGPTKLLPPLGVGLLSINTAEEMRKEVLANFNWASIVVKAAAVADFRPKQSAERKIKKGGRTEMTLSLEETPDILKELGTQKKNRILVGFSAETEDLLKNAEKKLTEKNLDLMVANDVTIPGAGFNWDTNIVKIIDRQGEVAELPLMKKEEVAVKIWDRIVSLIERNKDGS